MTIVDGASGNLTWDTLISGDALLDLSDPANPTVVTAGVYAVTANTGPGQPLTEGGYWELQIEMDLLGEDALFDTYSEKGTTGSITYFVPAGGIVRVHVVNADGGGLSHTFGLYAMVQRLS